MVKLYYIYGCSVYYIYGQILLHLWFVDLLHLWLKVITFLVSITFMVNFYYIYGWYYIYGFYYIYGWYSCSVASLDVEKLKNKQRGARLLRSESLSAMMCLDTFRRRRIEAVKERRMSAPSRVASDQIFTQQRNQLIVTVQIENNLVGKGIKRKTGLLKNTMELRRSRSHISDKIVRSTLNENSIVPLTKCHQNPKERKTLRSRSVPIEWTNLNEPNYRTTVDEETNENGLSYNRYQEENL